MDTDTFSGTDHQLHHIFFKDIVVIRSIMKCVALALIAFAAVANAEPGYGYGHHLGYGYGHHLGYGYGLGHAYGYGAYGYGHPYAYGHHYGKRSAEPTAAAEPGYGYYGHGYGHAYGHGYGHPYAYHGHHYGKRSAEAE